MTTSPVVLPARSTTTSYGVPPIGRTTRRARARRLPTPPWWRRGCGIAMWASLVVKAGLWLLGRGVQELAQCDTALISVGQNAL